MRYSKFDTELKRCNENIFNELAIRIMHDANRNKTLHDTFIKIMSTWQYMYCKSKHFFLDEGVMEFCYSSVKEFSEGYFGELPICDDVNPTWCKGYDSGGFFIHFPLKERRYSIFVCPNSKIPNSPNSFNTARFYAYDGHNYCGFGQELSGKKIDAVASVASIVFGVSLYMKAFPDTVVEKKYNDVSKKYRGTKIIVGRSQTMDSENHSAKSPHWRRGHFRLLSSDRYKDKKGKVVFVRGTFVKGKAYDVLDDAPAKEK
jgi:hypothetical protein